MRIVGGEFRGRNLIGPTGDHIRPTSDRMRQTVFDILAHAFDDVAKGVRVLDLFAGTGALGVEALSRGASYVLFVEEGVEARGLIRSNVDALGLTGKTRIFRRDATQLGPIGSVAPFGLVFADPPYGKGFGEKALASAIAGNWLRPGALAVLEEDAAVPVTLPAPLEEVDRRVVGDSQVVFGRLS